MEQWIYWLMAYLAFLVYSGYRKRELIKSMIKYYHDMLAEKIGIGVEDARP